MDEFVGDDVRLRADGRGCRLSCLAFAAPPLLRSGAVEESLVEHIASALGIGRGEIEAAQWADNGPGWVAVMLRSAEAVLAVKPRDVDLDLGVVGPYPDGSPFTITCIEGTVSL
jgi:predicted PhzF superfamily epimerase YddE/YHI9